MKKLAIFFVITIIFGSFPTKVQAGPEQGELSANANSLPNYYCKISRVVMNELTSEEILKGEQKYALGEVFIVERQTGIMNGILKNSYVTKPRVIDMGSTRNSYKVITTLQPGEGFGPGSNIHALTINEFEETENKPFVYLRNDKVYMGTCKHMS